MGVGAGEARRDDHSCDATSPRREPASSSASAGSGGGGFGRYADAGVGNGVGEGVGASVGRGVGANDGGGVGAGVGQRGSEQRTDCSRSGQPPASGPTGQSSTLRIRVRYPRSLC